MKTLTPVKAVALIALAAGLTLPDAKAQSPNPAVTLPAASAPAASPPASPRLSVGATPVTLAAGQRPVRDVLAMMSKQVHLDYVIELGVSGTVNVHLSGVPFGKALTTLLEANSQPLDCIVEYDPARGDVYHIQPRVAVTGAKEAVPATPRQVQIKFEWVASAGASGTAPDKSVDVLTIIAEEGRKAQVSSRHLRNGMGGEETITVLARLQLGGRVTMDITAYNDSTARAGETFSNATHTLLGCKYGETRVLNLSNTVSGSGPGQQSAQRALFVTPTIIGDGG